MSSLRERRRRRTEDSIRRAAVDLASAQGLEKVTIEMISEAAGISSRTFFNYFPFKEAAFSPRKLVFSGEHAEKFITGQDEMLVDIAALLEPLFQEITDDHDFVQKAHALACANQKLLLLRISAFHEFEVMIAELIKKRLAYSGETGDPHFMAALVLAAIRRGFEVWVLNADEHTTDFILKSIKDIPTAFLPQSA